uniref:Putative microfibrillar-associated protein mfap1 n=1 Tax=Corethrella appendiculata TaxID=1370023 RepID=U5EYX3_9DIPT
MNNQPTQYGIHSTAGAVPIKNPKGEISMQKVKVQRYISGKRPDYAQYASSDEETDEEDFIDNRKPSKYTFGKISELGPSDGHYAEEEHYRRDRDDDSGDGQRPDEAEEKEDDNDNEVDDPRLRRLKAIRDEDNETILRERRERHRAIQEPEFLVSEDDEESESEQEQQQQSQRKDIEQSDYRRTRRISLGSESESEDELSDTEIERRRQMLKSKMIQAKKEEEVLVKEDDGLSESTESESSEYEEETESEEENEPRLKPLFVRKKDRTTIIEKERQAAKQKQLDHEAKKAAKDRRRQTLRLVEESVKKDLEKVKADNEPNLNDVNTDDENDEVEYEAWKLRELKRIKRDREEKEQLDKERLEIDRIRNLTEEERRQELRLNPKTVTNKAVKGKYKFLQKYYHRGAFYLNEEDTVYKQDFSAPTLEDHFDKTILPKVMQVKNFGRCGRTKYTHLVDQDTTQFDSPWASSDTANNIKFHNERAGGMKQIFEKPSLYRKRKD